MDVKCERCSTEYEFDDALVSGRGTTVKCTNCGHKFKIRRSDGDFSEDFWNVTTGDGRTLVFTSLRELQRAIQGYLVERNDRLSRGGLPPKAIGQIPELVPFFEQREAAKRSQHSGRPVKTQDGLGPASSALAQGSARPRQATKPEFPAPPPDGNNDGSNKTTLIGTGPLTSEPAIPVAAPPPVPRVPSAPPPATERQPEPSFEPAVKAATEPPAVKVASAPPPVPPPRQRDSMNTVPLKRPPPPPPPATPRVSNPPPLPERARRSSDPGPLREPASAASDSAIASASPVSDVSSPLPPRVQRSLRAEIEEERDRGRGSSASISDGLAPRRRGVGGFIVAAVVAGCALMLGAVWAQKNLGTTLGGKPPAPAAAVDPRVATFLATGEKALADGNLELAKESLDKASALSEKDPHVLLGVARLAAVRADVAWLKSRLLPADAADDHRIVRDNLSDLAAAARKAADDALLVAPEDPAALRAKIDAARISGDREGARALVARIAASSAQRALDPETAYVLAALDLAEAEPLWSMVVERLKVASSAETGPGRARAALVYALARSGDGAGAKAEVERLVAMTRAHPLLPLLRAFADRAVPSAARDAGVSEPVASAASVPDAGAAARPAGGGAGGGGGALPTDVRALVSQGERARVKGDYERARALFTAAVEKNPSDSEALTGLAAIAYAQRDLAGARASYKRVLSINPNYMPAVVGLADVEWDAGDKVTASKMYKDIVDRYPEGAYPGRVKQRAEGGG